MEKKFYTPEDVRHEVFSGQISASTIMSMLHANEIPSIRMRKRYYIPAYWVIAKMNIADGKEASK